MSPPQLIPPTSPGQFFTGDGTLRRRFSTPDMVRSGRVLQPQLNLHYLFHNILNITRSPFSHIIKYNHSTFYKRFFCGKSDMGSCDYIFGVQQRMLLFNRRFGFEYINGGPGDGAAVQGICKRIAVHHRAAGRIDEDGAFLHH